MNSSSSLAKYAPRDADWTSNAPWRIVMNSEGLQYVASSMLSADPYKEFSHLKIRVNLGMSDAQSSYTNRIKSFFKALSQYPYIKCLDLGHCQISDYTCKEYLEPMLQQNQSIVDLKLNENAFTDEGANMIFPALGAGSVSQLDLSFNELTAASMFALSTVVQLDKFQSIDLSHTKIGAEGVGVLIPTMLYLKNFAKLVLENARIGDEGCLEFAKAFASSKEGVPLLSCLDDLNIADNHIGRLGIEKLLANFHPAWNTTLKKLDISKNFFGDEGFGFVTDMMKKNEHLHTLKVNRVGVTRPKFVSFCEMMQARYENKFGPYPNLEVLEVGSNGLGNDMDAMFSMLKQRTCWISAVNYEGNEVTTHGVKLFKKFMLTTLGGKNRKSIKANIDANSEVILQGISRDMKDFVKFSLKSNAVDGDACEHLADIIKGNPTFYELDLRKNAIGVQGAIFFKKAFRKMQCTPMGGSFAARTFKLHILPEDVGVEGTNHLIIGMREHPSLLQGWVKSKAEPYTRSEKLQHVWNHTLGKPQQETEKSKPVEIKENLDELFAGLKRPSPVPVSLRHHMGNVSTPFAAFNTPNVTASNKNDMNQYKMGVELYGENDEKVDTWAFYKFVTYTSTGVVENDRGIFKWHPLLWSELKNGYGAALGNTLYRYGLLLRLNYEKESEEYIRDLYLQRYGKGKLRATMKKLDDANTFRRSVVVGRLVADDVKDFWETLIHQTCNKSEGLTMFEFAIKYAKSPVVDCVRQFLNIFPAVAYGRRKSKNPAVFLQQVIAQSGQTYRSICLASTDKFVRRYAEAKKLVLFRFLEVEPVYTTKFVKVSKVEDLLLTEEYNDDERFFLMRRIAGTSAQSDEKLAENEFNAHRSFMTSGDSYLSCGEFTSFDKIDALILPNENMNLDVEFVTQISPMFNRKQLLTNDKLVPTFTKIYKTNMREVMDNESLAGGRDLARTQIMLRMIANSLLHFNNRDWLKDVSGEKDALASKPRVHGNVRPRNIVLRVGDELPDLYNGVDLMPGKWVLCDFSRSTAHGDLYLPMPNSAYNPPEIAKRIMSNSEAHLRCSIPATEKIDVWQFGCVLYEILAGAPLFKMEGNNDLIVDQRERGELINWLSLDEKRSSLILNQLKAHQKTYGGHSLSLHSWGNYDDEEIEKIIASATELVQWCLQGRPDDRPSFGEIMAHPFLVNVDVGRQSQEKDADAVVKIPTTKFGNQRFLKFQPHMHLINTCFDETGVIVKSLEHSLNQVGCTLTTDSVDGFSAAEYEKNLRSNVESARIVACILTSDCFYNTNVVKQLLFAEDFRKKSEKQHGRILFIDLANKIDLSRDNLKWDKGVFRNDWFQSDDFQYMVKALAEENPSLSSFGLGQIHYDDKFDAWNKFMNDQFRGMVLSYLQDPIKYESLSYLNNAMVDRMLVEGHLVPTTNISKLSAGAMGDKNYFDSSDLLNRKLEDRKEKFMNLYFLPAPKVKKGDIRVYVLCGPSPSEETFNAVSQIARALEAPSALNAVSKENKHKEASDPRNRLLNKVKTSFNIKKKSHLKVGGRATVIQEAKDKVMNTTREEGALLVVLYCTPGIFKTYQGFLEDAVEKRSSSFACVLVQGAGFNPSSPDIKKEIDTFAPKELRDRLKDKSSYLPYFKPKKDPWQYDSVMNELMKDCVHRVHNPTPREQFIPAK